MYILPNGSKIDEEGLFDAAIDGEKTHTYYLDSISGNIGFVDEPAAKVKPKMLDPKRYLKIIKITATQKCAWMQDFIREMVDDVVLGQKLKELAQNKAHVEQAIALLKDHPDGWEAGWRQWITDGVFDYIHVWMDTLPFKIEDVWEGDDDCEMCTLMDKPHTVGDFTEAVAKQKKKTDEKSAEPSALAALVDDPWLDQKDDLYYEAMELVSGGDYSNAQKLLLRALAIDPEYVQTYVGLVSVYGNSHQKKKFEESVKSAFEKTRNIFKKWPKKMAWGVLENRAFMRAIQYRAELYTDDGEQEQAIVLYRLLLSMNPADNQGVRYVLAGVYAGLDGKEINKMTDEGNENQSWDKLENLVEVQNTKHKFWKRP